MMEEKATVIAVNEHHVTVQSQVKSSCSSCHQVDSCGSGQVAKAIPHRKLIAELPNHLNVALGDEVILGISEDKLLISAWQVYFLPLIGLFLFAGIGHFMSVKYQLPHEFLTISLAFLGGFLGFKTASYFQGNLTRQANLMPRLVRKNTSNSM